ncbi:hypothetical protein NDU88_005260 [Pleurodeles waltl]|uniref:Uncharacterized protein n=1 Tax=Pleurodeles waltl TaxID=8319 RepID=A0AAV7NLY2_PLEWA|nr:hypothetical protein NDU88_005260 [Pleurodeles waltl]
MVGCSGLWDLGCNPVLGRGWAPPACSGSQSMLYAPSRVGPGDPSGRRRPREPGVSVCPLTPVQIPPWIFGPPGPRRFVHAAAPHLSPNVALWVAASPLHQFGVSGCRDRVLGSENFVNSTSASGREIPVGAWRLSVPPRPGADSTLDFRASGPRADLFTLLLLTFLLMMPYG